VTALAGAEEGLPWLVLGVPAGGHRAEAGTCWRCDAADVEVAWIGAIRVDGVTAPYTACRDCAEEYGRRARRYAR
jgi:hypothetical protein